jgi:hypothetical protein
LLPFGDNKESLKGIKTLEKGALFIEINRMYT